MQRLRLTLVLAGCSGAPTDSAADTSAPAPFPGAPVIESASVTCYEHTTGDHFVQWTAAATATDEQGNDTIITMNTIVIQDAGGVIAETPLLCSGGDCVGSWKDTDIPDLQCDTVAVAAYEFVFVVTDIDGHDSAAKTVHGTKE